MTLTAPGRARTPRARRLRRALQALTGSVAALATIAALGQAQAAFTATTTNGSNTFAAAATFPTYPTSVTGDTPWAYHRSDDAVSSSATSTANDTSANNRGGVYNGMTNGPSAYWHLDEGTGTVAADSSGAVNPGTLTGAGATWTTGGRTNKAVALDGSTGYVAGTGPSVATNASFSISAWVYLNGPSLLNVNKAIVTQPGTRSVGFNLMYNNTHKWVFMLPTADTDNPAVDYAISTADASLTTWTHLVGVYDSSASAGQQTKLYVNAGTATTAGHTTTWNATGALQAGRGRWAGVDTDYFPGRVDEVRTYRRALSAADVTALYGDNPSAQYEFEENTGTTTADNSGNANTATVNTSTDWTTAGHTGNALALSVNANSYASSTSSPIDATQSFSISVWVNLNTTGAVTRTIVSQQGTNYDTFILKYESSGKWSFILMQNSGGTADQVLSSGSATFNTWVHLVAVYDTAAAAGSKMKLYVNNGTAATGAHATAYGTTNPIQIGRTRWGGAWVDSWDGEVDDLHTYQRALTTTEIGNLYSPPATATMTAALPGALQGAQQGQTASTSVAFGGTTNAYSTLASAPGPVDFTTECWFKTTSTTGGQLIGYTADATGIASTSRDRMVFLDSGNRLTFGIWWNNAARVVRSPLTYNDGAWHHVATSYGPAGLKLYVDGALVASNTGYTQSANPAGTFAGYWRWGGGQLNWAGTNAPTDDYLTGTLDEVAIYSSQLSDQQIAWHYFANH